MYTNYFGDNSGVTLREYEEETHFQDAELIDIAKNVELKQDIKNYTSLRIGELFLDKYRIVKILGRGNSSIIYLLVSNDDSQKLFVLKEFFPKGFVERTDKEKVTVKPTLTKAELKNYHLMQEIFIGEAQNLMRVSSQKHPNLVHFLTAKRNINNTNYYIMSYEEGHTLKTYIENIQNSNNGKLTSKEITSLAKGLLQGIHHVHSAGVYHQDIKLENILIRNDGSPIIIDFGASVLVHDKENNKYYNTATLKYAAPEQMTMDNPPKINETTDIYNIGVLLYRLITGSFPPKADERKKSLESTGDDAYHSLMKQNLPDYNKSLLKAVDTSLNLAQDERFQNAIEFEKALHKLHIEKSFIAALLIPLFFALVYFVWPNSQDNILTINKTEQTSLEDTVPKSENHSESHEVTILSDINNVKYLLNGKQINNNKFFAKIGKSYTILAMSEGYEPQEYTIDYSTLSDNSFVLNNNMLDNQEQELETGTDLSNYPEEENIAPLIFQASVQESDEIALPSHTDNEDILADAPTIPINNVIPKFVPEIVTVKQPIIKKYTETKTTDTAEKLRKQAIRSTKIDLEKKEALKKRKAKQRKQAKIKTVKRKRLAAEKHRSKKRSLKKSKARQRKKETSGSVWYCVARNGAIIKSAKKSTRGAAKSIALLYCKKSSRGQGVCRVSCYLWK